MGDEAGAAGEQGRMIYRAGTAIGALPFFLRLTVRHVVTAQTITTG
jgi:hypothetical protein